MSIQAIVAVDPVWAIGRDGQLLFRSPEDLRQFRAETQGAVVIMGRKTFTSLPGTKGLPGRENWVLSRRDPATFPPGIRVFSDAAAVRTAWAEEPERRYFIIGGEQVYRLFLPDCSRVRVTRFAETAAHPDTYFPNLDALPDWKGEAVSAYRDENGGPDFTVLEYRRVAERGAAE